jgi:hypothetical protein
VRSFYGCKIALALLQSARWFGCIVNGVRLRWRVSRTVAAVPGLISFDIAHQRGVARSIGRSLRRASIHLVLGRSGAGAMTAARTSLMQATCISSGCAAQDSTTTIAMRRDFARLRRLDAQREFSTISIRWGVSFEI